MGHPTTRQVSEAKAYVRARVEAELSMRGNLEDLLRVASVKLADLAFRHGMSVRRAVNSSSPVVRDGVRRIMDWLMFMIEDYVTTLAVADHTDDSDIIMAYVKREQYGKDFGDRLKGYTWDFIYGEEDKTRVSRALGLLTSYAVTEGWMRWWGLNSERKGARGFYSFRGSSYPCDLCDSMVGYHPMSDYIGAWHPHCKCYFVFV